MAELNTTSIFALIFLSTNLCVLKGQELSIIFSFNNAHQSQKETETKTDNEKFDSFILLCFKMLYY